MPCVIGVACWTRDDIFEKDFSVHFQLIPRVASMLKTDSDFKLFRFAENVIAMLESFHPLKHSRESHISTLSQVAKLIVTHATLVRDESRKSMRDDKSDETTRLDMLLYEQRALMFLERAALFAAWAGALKKNKPILLLEKPKQAEMHALNSLLAFLAEEQRRFIITQSQLMGRDGSASDKTVQEQEAHKIRSSIQAVEMRCAGLSKACLVFYSSASEVNLSITTC